MNLIGILYGILILWYCWILDPRIRYCITVASLPILHIEARYPLFFYWKFALICLNSILVLLLSPLPLNLTPPALNWLLFLQWWGRDAIVGQDYCMNHLLEACDSAVPQYYFSTIAAERSTSSRCEFFLCFPLQYSPLWFNFSGMHRDPSTHFVNQIKHFWILLDAARWKVLDKQVIIISSYSSQLQLRTKKLNQAVRDHLSIDKRK